MARVKVKVDRGNGLQQIIEVDTKATEGATLGTDVRLPNGQVATPATFLTWLGGSLSSGNSGSGGPSLSTVLTTKGDLVTRDTQVQRLGIGTTDQALRVSSGGLPEWRSGAALSKADDTNVTLTLGGSPTLALLAATSLTLGWTGQLGETRGGTAQSSYLAGDMLYATALNTLGKLAIGTSGKWLGSSGSAPQWNSPAALTKTDDTNVTLTLGGSASTALLNAASLALGWTGQLGETRGGTAQSTYAAGDMLYASAINTLSKLTIGTSGKWLGSSGSAPQWNSPAALTKTDDTNVTLTLGGSASTALLNAASLTLGWTGQLGATRGGTAQSGYLTGDILYASALNTLSKLGIGSSGQVLTVVSGVPAWAAASGGATGANPTASVGLTAVNGSASTFMRSDGAPPIDQGIAPTWTAKHTFSASGSGITNWAVLASANVPVIGARETAAATDSQYWYDYVSSSVRHLGVIKNDESVLRDYLAITRSGTSITGMAYGNSTDNPAHTFYGQIVGTSFGYGISTPAFKASSGAPCFMLDETDGGTNQRYWRWLAIGGEMRLSGQSDDAATAIDILIARRTGNALTAILYGNSTDNPAHTFYGVLNISSPTNGVVATVGANQYGFFGTTGTLQGGMYFNGTTSIQLGAASNHRLDFFANGAVGLSLTTDGRFYGAALHNNSGAVTGTTNQYIASGTYTPTLTGVANVTGSAASQAQWIRVGNVVTVSGYLTVNPTTNALETKLGISLPIASAIANNYECCGVWMSRSGLFQAGTGIIRGDAANDRAEGTFTANATGSGDVYYTFTYLVL